MDVTLAAKVWHYWLAVPLFLIVALAVIGTVIGYLLRVTSAKYPKR